MQTESGKRIERMRNGEKIKCPFCEKGYWVAKGNPKTTNVFGCDKCEKGMVLTIPVLIILFRKQNVRFSYASENIQVKNLFPTYMLILNILKVERFWLEI